MVSQAIFNGPMQVRFLSDPFAPEVIAEEHLSNQEAQVRILLGAFAKPIRAAYGG
jgi:hypothetical protein